MNANEVIAGRANEILTGKRGGKDAGPSQRPCEQEPVVERQLPDRDAHRRGAWPWTRGCCRRSDDARPARRAVEALGRHRQDRPHSSAGRDAADARPGIFGLCRADRATASSGSRACMPRVLRLAQGGTAVGTGLNAPKGFAETFAQGGRKADAAAVHLGAEQVRRARGARHAGRAVGRAQRHRGLADQDRQRYPPARLGPALRARRAQAARERAGQLDHAGQGQSDPVRDADDGRGAGDGQSCRGDRRRAAGPHGAQRVQAADRGQRDPLDQPARDRHGELHRADARRGSSPTSGASTS